MKLKIPQGRGSLEVLVPKGLEPNIKVLASQPLAPLDDPEREVARALDQPLGCPPLLQIARGKTSAAVVISDKTRPVPNRLLLPPILERLARAGLAKSAICILVATGMHGPSEEDALMAMLGPEIMRDYRVVNHDCHQKSGLLKVAEMDGYPIEVNRLFREADLKIATGLIEPHPFAGFSGGGKSVVPGLAGFDSMRYLHSFAMVDHPRVCSLEIGDNPFQHKVREICGLVGLDMVLNVTMDHARQVTGVFAGALARAHDAGCQASRQSSVTELDRAADLVVTNGGGAPMDATLYQSTKGLMAAAGLVKEGGALLLVTGASEGLGSPEFVQLIREAGGPAGFRQRHGNRDRFVIDQWGAQAYFQVAEKAGEVLLHCPNLSREQVAPFGMRKVESVEQVLAELEARGGSLAVLQEGPYVVGAVCRGGL